MSRSLPAIIAFVLVVGAGVTFSITRESDHSLPPIFDDDLDQHPLYRTYNFGTTDNVFDVATQPLLFPTGLITEALKRDRIYAEALNEIGIEVRFHAFLKGRDVNHFLREGKVDAGIGGDAPTLAAIATMNAIAPVVVQRGFVSIVADHSMLVEDLEGKRIGYARGSNAHYALLAALEHRGLTSSDVRLVPMDITQMTPALDQGIVDAFSAWEPEPAEALNSHSEFVNVHQHIGTGFMYFAESLEEEHAEVLPLTVAAVVRAVLWIRASRKNLNQSIIWLREKTRQLTGKDLTLSDREIAALAERDLIGLFSLPELPVSDLKQNGALQKEYEFLLKLGTIPNDVHWEQVREGFRADIMASVLKYPERFRIDEFHYALNDSEIRSQ